MLKGTQGLKPLHTNTVQKSFQQNTQKASEPKDEQLRVSYGVIAEVNEDNSLVRVDVFDRNQQKIRLGVGPNGKGKGAFVPILQPITMIHQQFGALRKGLLVRVFWRGKHYPAAESIIEIISDAGEEIFTKGQKKPRSNELATGPCGIFTGGMTSF